MSFVIIFAACDQTDRQERQTEEEPFKYFNYSSHSGHTFEVGAGYILREKFPLSVSWYTTFAGNDYRENDKRAWSSYCEHLPKALS